MGHLGGSTVIAGNTICPNLLGDSFDKCAFTSSKTFSGVFKEASSIPQFILCNYPYSCNYLTLAPSKPGSLLNCIFANPEQNTGRPMLLKFPTM